jgi:nitrite reductase/ring-hydroxylating ferredoxin subunit
MEIALCERESLPDGEMRQFELDGITVLLCRADNKFFATNGICPHRGAQLASGTIQGTIVTCPWHEWSFDCADGCGITNPQSQLTLYRVWEQDGHVYVELPD